MKKILILILSFFILISTKKAEDFAENAKSAILIDYATGKVLYEKNPDERLAPASMTKIASMLIIMEYIDSGKISIDENVTISKEAASMGGSQIFAQEGETYKVSELLKGIAIASGNDAVYAMAERIAGSHDEFVKLMNEKCNELGCTNTNFVNVHGLDQENHYSSARDMALLARELIKHEKILEYTSTYEEYLNKPDGSKTWLVNTNKLIRFYNGVDGLKTGYTSSAGYCLTATGVKNNLRLISVVMSEPSSDIRSSETVKMLNYGFNTYKIKIIKSKEEILGNVKVEKGKKEFAEVTLLEDMVELQNISDENKEYSFNIKVDKLKAPIKKGDSIGKAEVFDNEGNIIGEVDLTVKEDIEKANMWDFIKRNFKVITSGKILIKN